MSAPTRPDKVHALDVLEARVRARLERVRDVLTRELAPRHIDTLCFDAETHRFTRAHGRLEVRCVQSAEEAAQLEAEDDLPRRDHEQWITIGAALAWVTAEAEAIVAHTVTAIWARVHSPLVPGALRNAVLGREELVARWPWDEQHEAAGVLLGLIACVPPRDWSIDEPSPYGWPADVAPRAVADWIEPILKPERPAIAAFRAQGEVGAWARIEARWRALAVLYAVLHAVQQDRHRRAMAIDAGRPHHDFLEGLRDLPKDTRTPHDFSRIDDGRIELVAPGGGCVQLALDYGEGSPSEALITALRELRGWKGLRHYAAVHKLLSVDGGRQGWVRWTLDGHLDALGISIKHRSKTEVRAQVARQVEAFTKIEIAVYAKDGTLRTRRPLLIVGAKYDRLKGSAWELDGMQLEINPLLYAGVREPGEHGRLGRNWHPAPVELAAVDHTHHPYTLALGLILPIRWRLALEEDHDHITLTGERALRLAGITYKAHNRLWRAKNAGHAWQALERDLAELHRIGGLGQWKWDDADTPRTLDARLHLWPAPWMLDRTLHAVRPRELPPGPAVLTGAELKVWRTRHGLTQAAAAKKIGVSLKTIKRAEATPHQRLTPALTAKMRTAGAAEAPAAAVDVDDSEIRADHE